MHRDALRVHRHGRSAGQEDAGVVQVDGTEITGRLLNIDTLTLQMMDSQEKLRFFQKSNLREYSLVKKSPMPSFKGRLTTEELADLVSYLVSLKGI